MEYKPMTTKNALNSKIRVWKSRQQQLRRAWIDYDLKIANAYMRLQNE